jgi:hypothetical protein
MDLEEIELVYNLDFEPEIKQNYKNIIIDIFNNKCPENYFHNSNSDILIIVALYYISIKDYSNAISILLGVINNNVNYKACSTLGILYNILNDKINSLYYFKIGALNKHNLSTTNLAYEYLCQGDFDNFLLYNNFCLETNDENAMINLGIYEWNVLKNYNKAEEIFNKLLITNNYRAYYEYAKLVSDINKKKELLLRAIQLKPKICYIEMLIKLTGDNERYILYKKYNININKIKKIDVNIKNEHIIYNRCPICIVTEKKELFRLKCNHSFCNNCIIKYCKNKCCLCYV